MTDLAAAAAPEPAAASDAAASAPARIATLDIVRGVAVMGILAMNIVAFTMPFQAYINPTAYGLESQADLGSWLFSFIFIDGKMRGLFSFLFGASMLLVIERAEAAGESPAKIHYSRMIWLLIFGLAHFFFIWFGDILALYSPIGMLAYCFRRMSGTKLVVIGIILLVLQTLLYTGFAFSLYQLQAAAAAPGATAETLKSWSDLQGEFMGTPQQIQEIVQLYRGGYGPILHERMFEEWMQPLNSLWQAGGETLAYMLFGMAALKSGFLTGAWERRAYLKAVAIGFGIGIPIYALIAWWLIGQGFSLPALIAGWMAATVPVRPLMIVAIAAAIILLTRNGGWLTRRIAAAGRAAFTNYLGTSVLMTLIFYGYGLGWFGYLSRIELWIPVLGAWVIMLLWSKPWLDRFAYGPFEWLWRSLARGRFQPMRKR
jgi:uncharacterized protein